MARDRIHELSPYWNEKRLAKQLDFEELGKMIGKSSITIHSYFIGRYCPDEPTLRLLCDILDADFEPGKQAFLNIYHNYDKYRKGVPRSPRLLSGRTYTDTNVPPPNIKARAYIDTYWNRLRVAKNMTMDDIAAALGFKGGATAYPAMYDWFNGRGYPPKKWIKKICDLFEVDYETGIKEFKNGRKDWQSEYYNRSFKYSYKENKDDLMTLLYGKIPYETYLEIEPKIKAKQYKTAFSQLFSIVDFDTYYALQTAVTKISIADIKESKYEEE